VEGVAVPITTGSRKSTWTLKFESGENFQSFAFRRNKHIFATLELTTDRLAKGAGRTTIGINRV
jgi:hypothetical protein